ncbi:hypothetical protein ERO13_A06G036900v2 [Gossypium hirsutum]|nr:hypothetical protein ERO13_A06G036900v2 [Gossypium hirsutum]
MAYPPGTGAVLAYGGLAWLLEALYGAYGAGGGLLRRRHIARVSVLVSVFGLYKFGLGHWLLGHVIGLRDCLGL